MEENKYCYKYPHPAVTTDCVIFGFDGERLQVLLVERGIEPYKGRWAFPGGFLKMDETAEEGALRELKEETGLDFEPIDAADMYTKSFFTTIGMTDESCGTVYGYASGTVSKEGQEETEDIEIVLADRAEVKRILQEEKNCSRILQ